MDTTQLHKLINHRYRRWMVSGTALAIVLVGGLPATDKLLDSKRKRHESQEAIHSISSQSGKIPELRVELSETSGLVTQESGINHAQVSQFRDECLRLIRNHSCRAESVNEGRSLRQPWYEDLQPLVISTAVVKEKPKYEVITNSLNFTIVGELRHLVSLIEDFQSLNDFFVPSKLSIQQHGFERELKLEVEMAMIELVKSTSAK